jgi:hypothetical protein
VSTDYKPKTCNGNVVFLRSDGPSRDGVQSTTLLPSLFFSMSFIRVFPLRVFAVAASTDNNGERISTDDKVQLGTESPKLAAILSSPHAMSFGAAGRACAVMRHALQNWPLLSTRGAQANRRQVLGEGIHHLSCRLKFLFVMTDRRNAMNNESKSTKLKQVEGNLLAALATYALLARRQGRTEVFEWAQETLARLGFFDDMPEDISRFDGAIRAGLLGFAATAALESNQATEQLALDAFLEHGVAVKVQNAADSQKTSQTITVTH